MKRAVYLQYHEYPFEGMMEAELLEIIDVAQQHIKLATPRGIEYLACRTISMERVILVEDTRRREMWLNMDRARAFTKILALFRRAHGSALINANLNQQELKLPAAVVEKPHPAVAKILKEYYGTKNAFLITSGDEIDIALKEAYHSKRGMKSPEGKDEPSEPIRS